MLRVSLAGRTAPAHSRCVRRRYLADEQATATTAKPAAKQRVRTIDDLPGAAKNMIVARFSGWCQFAVKFRNACSTKLVQPFKLLPQLPPAHVIDARPKKGTM